MVLAAEFSFGGSFASLAGAGWKLGEFRFVDWGGWAVFASWLALINLFGEYRASREAPKGDKALYILTVGALVAVMLIMKGEPGAGAALSAIYG